MCVDRARPAAAQTVSHEPGRPMPLDWDAASKAILADPSPRVSTMLTARTQPGPTPVGRCAPSAAPASASFAAEGDVVGSIGLVLSEASLDGGEVALDVQDCAIQARRDVSTKSGEAA
jgi:DNA-binding IclR family transcriptional regulator